MNFIKERYYTVLYQRIAIPIASDVSYSWIFNTIQDNRINYPLQLVVSGIITSARLSNYRIIFVLVTKLKEII